MTVSWPRGGLSGIQGRLSISPGRWRPRFLRGASWSPWKTRSLDGSSSPQRSGSPVGVARRGDEVKNEEWRVVHSTRGSTLKQLWARLRSGLWVPTERFMYDGQAMPPILGGAPDVIDKQVLVGADSTRRYTGTLGFDAAAIRHMCGWADGATLLALHNSDRFTGISGLSGATIDVSNIQKYGLSNGQGSPQTKLYANDVAAPVAPTSAAEFDALVLTTAGADWDANSVNDAWCTSTSLNTVIQELADSHDPSAIQIVHKNDGPSSGYHYQDWDTFDNDNTKGAKLHIEFTPGGPPAGKPTHADNYMRRRVVQG